MDAERASEGEGRGELDLVELVVAGWLPSRELSSQPGRG